MGPDYKTATVFGGTGFIGSQVVRALASHGVLIKVAARVPERAYDLKPCGHVGQIVPFPCKMGDAASIEAAIKGSDYVINCVGILNQNRRASFKKIHVDLPRMIAEACARQGVSRLVHVSALGVTAGRSKYAASKRDGEAAVRQAFPQAVILRPSAVFGPGDSFFNKFAALGRYVPVMPLIGGGKTRLQPVYVGDVAEAAVAALTIPADVEQSPLGRVYELGGPEVVDFRRIYQLVYQYTGRSRPMIPLPWALAMVDGALLGILPNPVLTMDQVESLKTDTVVSVDAHTLADLGIAPTGLELVLPGYLGKFRAGGPFRALEKASNR
jgi:uncharacterized protein YbjT (DUF2867 family)